MIVIVVKCPPIYKVITAGDDWAEYKWDKQRG